MNDIGERVNDYIIIDHCRGKDNSLLCVAKCNTCGHIKKMKYAELKRNGASHHSKKNCKIDYYLNLNINSDYVIDQTLEPITKSKHMLTPFRCKICGHIRYMSLDKYGTSPWEHNVHNCGEDVYKERIGEQVDDYKIIDYVGLRESENGNKNPIFKCQCQICKRIKNIELSNLSQHHGTTHHSCSQLLDRNQPYFKNFEKKWADMRTRTTNPISDHFEAYGSRGIKSDEFENFTDFYDTLYSSFLEHVEKYGIKNTTLERIDVNKDYSRENCTWATWEEQFNNKQSTVYFKVIYPDKSEKIFRNIAKYEADLGVPHNTIYYRLNGKIKSNMYNGCKYIMLGKYSDLTEEDKNEI